MKDKYLTKAKGGLNDFTEKNYKKILRLALKRYKFVSYGQALKETNNFILLRHDVDSSPQRALALSKIESKLKIKATYCVQLGGLFYNPFEPQVRKIFLEIKNMGHNLGVHFDAALHGKVPLDRLVKPLLNEKNILEKLFKQKIEVLSFHNPVEKYLNRNKRKIASLINSYDVSFSKGIKYISDSNGYWRFDKLYDVLLSGKYKKLHILIHPCWWQKSIMSPWKKIKRCIEGKGDFTARQYRESLKTAGRKNIGYENDTIRR